MSTGSMTVKRDLSKWKCRSISGRVPRPIEPKPIMTIGPVIVPCIGQFCIVFSEDARAGEARGTVRL